MSSLLLLTAVGFGLVLIRAAVATRDLIATPAIQEPFEATGTGDPSADTLCGEEGLKTLAPTDGGWQVCVYRSLADVEIALDRLEVCGFAHREVHALANDIFAVRWR